MIKMTPGPTPSSRENSVKEDPKKRSRSYNGQKTYSGVPEEKYDGASYTSPYWDSYGRKEFSYQGGLGSYNGGDLDRGPLYSDYGGYIYPTERGNGCGGSGGLEPGWRRALSEPGLPVILLVAGAYAVYVLNNAIPTMFRRRKKRSRQRIETRQKATTTSRRGRRRRRKSRSCRHHPLLQAGRSSC